MSLPQPSLQQQQGRQAAPQAQAQANPQPARRLTIREIQERKRRAEEMEQVMEEAVATARLANDTDKLIFGLLTWATCLFEGGLQSHRALPLLKEAGKFIPNPPRSRQDARMRGQCGLLLGSVLSSLGLLEEAEAALIEVCEMWRNLPPEQCSSQELRGEFAELYFEQGRLDEAFEIGLALAGEHWQNPEEIDPLAGTFLLLSDICDAQGREEEGHVWLDRAEYLTHRYDAKCQSTHIKALLRLTHGLLREGKYAECEKALEMSVPNYIKLLEMGIFTGYHKGFPVVFRQLAQVKRALGKEQEALAWEQEVDETEAIRKAMDDSALAELRAEIVAERAAATASPAVGASSSGGASGKKKPTRKQQKRKAAQRRKAEARAVGETATEVAAAGGGGTDEELEDMTAAAAVLSIKGEAEGVKGGAAEPAAALAAPDEEETEKMDAQQLLQEEPEPEPEECAICLGDLPPPGTVDAEAEGAVLLACSHVFHADCLGRWKDKCVEKGLRFTCAMCRGAVVVAKNG